MEITSIASFLTYLGKTRQATNSVIRAIPPDRLDWTYAAGKFTIGDLLRHIAAIERHVFAEIAIGNPPAYRGCGKELADGYEPVLAYFSDMHEQSVALFRSVPDAALRHTIPSVDGRAVSRGDFLRALFVHEAHHRGALCIYLNLLGVATPPVLGLTEEQVITLSNQPAI